jgi:hypothetical protein
MKDFLSHAQAKFGVISAIDPTADQVKRALFD